MIQFPNMIDWIDEMSLKELHSLHRDFNQANEEKVDFSKFVEMEYESAKTGWVGEMTYSRQIADGCDPDGADDVCLDTAKYLFKRIFDKGTDLNRVSNIICDDDLAPDHNCALMVAESFWYKVVPAIEKTLKGLVE